MWMIVFYHFHTHLFAENPEQIFKAIQLPLHIAVLNFILISGYFGIHFSIKGICNLLTKVAFYALLIFAIKVVWLCCNDNIGELSLREYANNLFCISRTSLWFVRSYILLYAFSPFLNKMLSSQNGKERFYFILCLAIFSVYMGTIGVDHSLNDGKNLVNFMLIYSLGATIRQYDWGSKLSLKGAVLSWILFSGILFAGYMMLGNTIAGRILWRLSFGYNSPLLIASSLLFFVIFTKIHINSRAINWLASSVFAVYLIHENSNVNIYIYDFVQTLYSNFDMGIFYPAIVLFATLVVILCILIDKISLPIQNKCSALLTRGLDTMLRFIPQLSRR